MVLDFRETSKIQEDEGGSYNETQRLAKSSGFS